MGDIIDIKDQLPGDPSVRAGIQAFEAAVKASGKDLGPEACVVENFFAGGVYTRVMHAPAGMVFTGMIHKFDVTSILVQGRILVGDEFDGARELSAPCIWNAPRGVKRMCQVLEHCIWITVHQDPGVRDEESIRAALVAESYEELES